MTAVVLAVLLAIAGGLSLVVRQVVSDQEDRLLAQRTEELSTLVTNLADQVELALDASAGLAFVAGESPATFSLVVAEFDALGDVALLLDTTGDAPVILAGGGGGFEVSGHAIGGVLTGAPADAVARATEVMAGTPVVREGDVSRFGFAKLAPQPITGRAVYVEFHADTSQSALDPESFENLDAGLFAGTQVDEDQLVLRSGTGPLPTGDDIGRAELPVGQETWLVIAKARTPLVGSVAAAAPWIVLASGLAVALLTTALVEVLLRRQAYALTQVDERTAELQAAQVELEAAGATKDEFLANVSHELRTPLTSVQGFSELLLSTTPFDDETRERMLRAIANNAASMAGMVERLLDYARLTAGRIQFEPRPVGLEAQIDAVVGSHSHDFGSRAVRVEVPPGLTVRGDPDGLARILGNLLSNAAKFAPADQPIDIAATLEGDAVVIRVVDRGPGVSVEQAESLFERFVQGGAPSDRPQRDGLGLGLAIARRYVELHGGRIWFEPHDGTGATVAFSVPLAPELVSVPS